VLILLLTACGPDATAWRNPAPIVSVLPELLAFPATAPGETSWLTLQVVDDGAAGVVLDIAADAPFGVDRARLEVPGDATGALEVSFRPTGWDDVDGTLRLTDAAADAIDVALTGAVLRDVDGDGVDAAAAGGTDCDDADADIHPGATDTCGDGVDADCAPAGDFDCDADGFDGAAYGGTDCDDGDPAVFPGAVETGPDDRDEDCDGIVDEVLAAAGDLVLTELSPQPPAWVEVCNTTARTLALGGYTLTTAGGTAVLDAGRVEPGACAAICASTLADCAFVAQITLDAYADTVAVTVDGVGLDTVVYDAGWGWQAGRTWSLDPRQMTATANDAAAAWCLSGGSPGTPNPACP
jgi:hypothetical protein